MLRSVAFVAASLCSLTAAVADGVTDPTFNGVLPGGMCGIVTMMVCGDDYCQVLKDNCVGDHCGVLEFSLGRKTYQFLKEPEKTLEIVDASKAEVNKPLWIKFKVTSDGWTGNALVSMEPNGMGGYSRSATLRFKKDTTHQHDLIVTLNCDING